MLEDAIAYRNVAGGQWARQVPRAPQPIREPLGRLVSLAHAALVRQDRRETQGERGPSVGKEHQWVLEWPTLEL